MKIILYLLRFQGDRGRFCVTSRSLALGRFNSQHVDAIQTENLIRRVMGITSINDGSNHANREYISNPTSLPEHR